MKPSRWEVTSQVICDSKMYAVYRIKDMSAVDHSGNRELGSEYMTEREEAQRIANELNNAD